MKKRRGVEDRIFYSLVTVGISYVYMYCGSDEDLAVFLVASFNDIFYQTMPI